MKRTKLGLLFVLSGTMILASCGASAPKAKKYLLTFHQTEPGEIQDVVVTVIKGKTTNQEVWEQEPEINPKVGYTSNGWEDYDVTEMTADLTVVPVYTAVQYTATFINRVTGATIGTDQFTVEDESLDYPSLPQEVGYTYAWESVTISAQNLTVYCDRTANQHTVKFFADEEKTQQVGETLTFSIETTSLTLPDVPVKDGYDGSWPAIDFACDRDLELVAQYEEHSYYLQFKVNGENVGSPVGYHLADTWADVDKPEVPSITGYTVVWPESVTLEHAEQDNPQVVNAIVTANTYTVSYEGSTVTTSVTFDSPYTLEDPTAICDWYYNDEKVATSGTKWSIASNVTLTKKQIDVRLIDFEDGENRIVTKHDGTVTLSVVDGEGVGGSKALLADFGSQGHLDFNRAFLDAVFADSNIKALSFYAKASVATSNFRHIQVDQSVVHGSAEAFYCYEANRNGYGVDTGYKQFYLTRGVYEVMTSSDWSIQYGTTGKLYLDNLSVSYHDYFDAQVYGLEYGWLRQDGVRNYYLYNPMTHAQQLLIRANSDTAITSCEPDYNNYTEGVRSIKTVKTNGNVNFTLKGDYQLSNLTDEGVFVDLRISSKWNEAWHNTDGTLEKGSLATGANGAPLVSFAAGTPSSRTAIQNIPGEWQTFHFKKSDIDSVGTFLTATGSASGDINIDNIRAATAALESFESAYAYQSGLNDNVVAGASSYPVSEQIGTKPEVFTKCDYLFTTEWGNVSKDEIPSAEISNERASDGTYSLKLSLPKANPLRVRRSYLQTLIKDGGSLSFDVFSDDLADDKLSFTTLGGNVKTITKGQWTTITLTAADFLKEGATEYQKEGRFTEKAFGAGTIYVDNLRYIPAA